MKTPVKRFLKMTATSSTCFALDLAIIYTLVEFIKIHYTAAIAIGFITAHSINYILSANWTFRETKINKQKGYVSFFLIALIGTAFLVPTVLYLTETLHLHYLLSKIVSGAALGLFNFFGNYIFTFRMSNELKLNQ